MFAIGPGAVWHTVDLHVHSLHTRGCKHAVRNLLDRAQVAGVALLALTDNNSVQGIPELLSLSRTLPLRVLPGVELTIPGGRRGVHVLCIFPEDTEFAQLEQMLHRLMLPRTAWGDPEFILPATPVELHAQVAQLGGICVAAHPHADFGLAAEMETGQLASWKRIGLLQAVEQPVCGLNLPVLSGSDAMLPEQIGQGTTRVKMEFPGFHELRAALNDPASRLAAAPQEPRLHIESISVSGGLLDGLSIRFNPHLNCITGGRGTGKSSLVNCLRLAGGRPALDQRLRLAIEQQLSAVLGDGKVELTVEEIGLDQRQIAASMQGSTCEELVAEVFSQGEMEAAALSPEYRLQLLDYHADPDGLLRSQLRSLTEQLEQNTRALLACEDDLAQKREPAWEYEEIIGQLPAQVGLDWEQLWESERKLYRQEERHRLIKRLAELSNLFLNESRDIFSRWQGLDGADAVYESGNDLVQCLESGCEYLLQQAEQVEQDQVDASDHLKYRQQIRRLLQLQPDVEQSQALTSTQETLKHARNELLQQRRLCYEQLRKQRVDAVNSLNRVLVDVKLSLLPAGSHGHLQALLQEMLPAGSAWSKCARVLAEHVDPLSLAKAAENDDADSLELFGLSRSRVQECLRLIRVHRHFRQLDACPTEDRAELWLMERGIPKRAEELSAGQRCTALLPLLLLSGDKPLVIDQPEDNLDNAYIFDAVVPALRTAKFKRQLIIVTHNPNLPVLGDAELAIVLESDGRHASVLAAGYLEQEHVSEALQRILEGGRQAFLRRAHRYGWEVNANERHA